MVIRIVLWLLCFGYFLYVWNFENVRESFGVNRYVGDFFVDDV